MSVLEQHQHRLPLGKACEPALQQGEGPFLAPRRTEVRLLVDAHRRDPQHAGNERNVRGRKFVRSKNRFQFAQALLVRVAAREAGLLLPARDDRMKRATLM